MNGTSGFQEVRSSTSRSPNRFLHEQRHRFGIGSWHLLHTHDPIALFTGISTKRVKVPDTFSISKSNGIDLEQVPGTFSMLTISALSPQGSAQRKKRLC